MLRGPASPLAPAQRRRTAVTEGVYCPSLGRGMRKHVKQTHDPEQGEFGAATVYPQPGAELQNRRLPVD